MINLSISVALMLSPARLIHFFDPANQNNISFFVNFSQITGPEEAFFVEYLLVLLWCFVIARENAWAFQEKLSGEFGGSLLPLGSNHFVSVVRACRPSYSVRRRFKIIEASCHCTNAFRAP